MVLALSFSGETEEVTRLIPVPGHAQDVPLIAITGNPRSALGRAARVTLDLGPLEGSLFAWDWLPAPARPRCWPWATPWRWSSVAAGSSTTRISRGFIRVAVSGRKLAKVEDVMRPLGECRVADQSQSVREVLVRVSRPGRRTGAIMLIDAPGTLDGTVHRQRSGSHVGTQSGHRAGPARLSR